MGERDFAKKRKEVMFGDMVLTESSRQRGLYTGIKKEVEEGSGVERTSEVELRIARSGYNLKINYYEGGKWKRQVDFREAWKDRIPLGVVGDEKLLEYIGNVR
jgi:hypothetical protein